MCLEIPKYRIIIRYISASSTRARHMYTHTQDAGTRARARAHPDGCVTKAT